MKRSVADKDSCAGPDLTSCALLNGFAHLLFVSPTS
jgi:hypothetical protein